MELILAGAILLAIILLLIYYFFGDKISFSKKNDTRIDDKSKELKKEDIIKQYEDAMKSLIEKYKDDNEELIKQKQLFLQKVNNELARNIFFDNSEIKKVIDRLLKL